MRNKRLERHRTVMLPSAQLADAEGEAAFGTKRHCRVNLGGLRPDVVRREAAQELHQRKRVFDLRQRAANTSALAGGEGQIGVFLSLLGALGRKALRIQLLGLVPIFRAVMQDVGENDHLIARLDLMADRKSTRLNSSHVAL